MEVMQPGSKNEFDILFSECYKNGNPSYIRIAADEHGFNFPVALGKGVIIKETPGAKVTIVTAGPLLANVVAAAADLNVNILYYPTIKPFDVELLNRFTKTRILVVHDAYGLFEAVNAACVCQAAYHGLPDAFCCFYGTLQNIRQKLGLDSAGIHAKIGALL